MNSQNIKNKCMKIAEHDYQLALWNESIYYPTTRKDIIEFSYEYCMHLEKIKIQNTLDTRLKYNTNIKDYNFNYY